MYVSVKMLYPEAKEREERFKLALRMGLPIFFLTVILFFVGFSTYFAAIPDSFWIVAISILGVMVYYIFYLIYIGSEERITDSVSHTFTREYLTQYMKKEIIKGPYTVMLISIENLYDINERYSPVNGDKVLKSFARWIGDFFEEKGIERFPIGHYKGGDFLIGLPGHKHDHTTMFDLLCIKSEHLVLNDIEIKVTGAIVDTALTTNIEQLITRLFTLQTEKRSERESSEENDELNPSELELSVINAIKSKRFSVHFQAVFEHGEKTILEAYVKLINHDGTLIHQNSYMPVINRLGLTREYDIMMIENLIDICSRHSEPFIYALNIFPSTVRNQQFFDHVQMLLSNNVVAKGHILFVLGEQEYFSKPERFNDMLQSYRRSGVLVALDRLGGYQTTLMYLKNFAVDIVRFDINYGKHIKESGYQGILKGLNKTAQVLGVKSWVKMLEDEESAALAESIGINFIQGNALAKIGTLEESFQSISLQSADNFNQGENDEIR
jgi:EAL domain-containing protein (putative c-di-GMP-specific phosphodiesterase class I)